MMIKVLITTLFLILAAGCSAKKSAPELKYTLEEFNHIVDSTGAAPDKTPGSAINFSDYSPGVNRTNSRPLMYERLGFSAIEFETEKQARDEAHRLNQYYSRNWLFDKVEGEPILEDLVITKFHATNPKRRIQRKPVHIPKTHHSGAGSAPAAH